MYIHNPEDGTMTITREGFRWVLHKNKTAKKKRNSHSYGPFPSKLNLCNANEVAVAAAVVVVEEKEEEANICET